MTVYQQGYFPEELATATVRNPVDFVGYRPRSRMPMVSARESETSHGI